MIEKELTIKSKQEQIQEFTQEYNQICIKYHMQIEAFPIFKFRDDGTWSILIQYRIIEMSDNQ